MLFRSGRGLGTPSAEAGRTWPRPWHALGRGWAHLAEALARLAEALTCLAEALACLADALACLAEALTCLAEALACPWPSFLAIFNSTWFFKRRLMTWLREVNDMLHG